MEVLFNGEIAQRLDEKDREGGIIFRKTLAEMPLDMSFDNQLCHATGDAVIFASSPEHIWAEYETKEGKLYYGRN